MKSKFIWLVALFAAFMLAACEPVEDEEGDTGPATEESEEESEDLGNGVVGSIVGEADVDSFSMSVEAVVVDAGDTNGVTATVSVFAGDRHNHPVADETRISFWTEFGLVEESCTTQGGSCTVTWTSDIYCPIHLGTCRPLDGLSTLIAFTLGEDSFLEAGERNGVYNVDTDSDFLTVDETIISTPELFYDRNFDDYTAGSYVDAGTGLTVEGDTFEDYNNDSTFNASSSKYRGTRCSAGAIAEDHCEQTQVHVWDHTQLVLHEGPLVINLPVVANWDVGTTYNIEVTDQNGNYPPSGTTLSVSEYVDGVTTEGIIYGVNPVPVVGLGLKTPHVFQYEITSTDAAGTLQITVTGGGDTTTIWQDHNP